MSTGNRALLERYVDWYNAGDLEACMDLYAADAVQTMPDGTFKGPAAIRERLATDLRAFPDARYTVDRFLEEGDSFADEYTIVGTNTGPLSMPDGAELPPTGKRVVIKGMEFVQLRDGKIVIDNLYYDSAAIAIQLGLVPQPATARS